MNLKFNKVIDVGAMATVVAPYPDTLIKELTIPIYDYTGKLKHKIYLAQKNNDGTVSIPRALVEGKAKLSDMNWETIDIQDSIELRENQKPIIRDFLNFYKPLETFGGIITAKTGSGKTIMALKILSILKMKTLIVVPTIVLLHQWIERITEFTNITANDIGIIQGSKNEYKKPIVVGVLKSLSMFEYPSKTYNSFGLTIFDEGHLLGAKTFSKVAKVFNSKFRLMLSATPRRKDGADKVFSYNIGKFINKTETKILKPVLKVLKSKSVDEKDCYIRTREGIKFSAPKFLTKLAKSKVRNEGIATLIAKLVAENRRILVLSDRIEQLKSISQLLCKYDVGWAIGSKKDTNHQIILGTYQVAGLGLDIPELDTLIFATPRTDIEQAVGRIVRKHDGKKQPLIIDIVDWNSEVMKRYYYSRLKMYRKMNIL